jgi:hypothetical protein
LDIVEAAPTGVFFSYLSLPHKRKKLLERLDQAMLDVIDNPAKTKQTTDSGTLL